MNIKGKIPDLFTSLNLLAGCFGIMALFENKPIVAAFLIIAGSVCDFFDGFFARLLKTGSMLGKELDSLADLITFGLLPAFLMYYIMNRNGVPFPYISFVMVLAAAFRLARFNTENGHRDDFLGLPTPANAFFVTGFIFIYLADWTSFRFVFNNPGILTAGILILSYLMISNIRFLSLKFRNMKWRENGYRYLVLVSGMILIIFLRFEGIFFAMLVYLIISVYRHFSLLFKMR